MNQQAVTKHFALIGHPVSHSLSPRIHQAFGRQAGIALAYAAIDSDDFESTLQAFDGNGANITLPYKQRALAACSTLSCFGPSTVCASFVWTIHTPNQSLSGSI